jgi:hypothetical protein
LGVFFVTNWISLFFFCNFCFWDGFFLLFNQILSLFLL